MFTSGKSESLGKHHHIGVGTQVKQKLQVQNKQSNGSSIPRIVRSTVVWDKTVWRYLAKYFHKNPLSAILNFLENFFL